MSDVGFLICVERGRLETEGVLLAESLRAWGGAASEAPLYVFAPRAGEAPEPATVERLRALGANYVDEVLNTTHSETPIFNKVFVSAWAERQLEHETLVFVDTDSVFLGEPAELLGGNWLAAARPVDRRIAGSRGKGKNEPFWRRVYATLGVQSEPFVETTLSRMRIRAYWNSGLIAARRAAGLFSAWKAALDRLFEAGVVYKRMPHFMDQIAWAAVTADVHDRILVLPVSYNYPLRHRQGLPPPACDFDLAEMVHLHYRLWFHLPEPLQQVVPALDQDSERYRWLDERLPLEPLEERSTDPDSQTAN